jgi:tetratricopeptide (TPR) repeat protein
MLFGKYRFAVFIFVLFGSCLSTQGNYQEKYLELLEDERFGELKILLGKWEKSEPVNLEMYIAYFNYYCNLDLTETLTTETLPDGSYEVYRVWEYNKNNVYKGITYLDKALAIIPARLDIYWGKIEALFVIEDYKTAGETLSALIEISPKYNDSWVLGSGKKLGDSEGESYLLEYINQYYATFLDDLSPEAANALINCATQQIKTYPGSTYAYNILAVYYLYRDDRDTALEYLLTAEQADSGDCIILLNIGRLYAEMQNNAKANEYFSKVLKIGDAEERDTARQYLDEYNL